MSAHGNFPGDPVCRKCGAAIRVCTHTVCSKDQRELADIGGTITLQVYVSGIRTDMRSYKDGNHQHVGNMAFKCIEEFELRYDGERVTLVQVASNMRPIMEWKRESMGVVGTPIPSGS